MQVAADSVQAVTTNPVFQNWTIGGGLVAAVSFLVWILVKDSPGIGQARLEIRELVSSVFQQVVIQEARIIFKQVDDRLPHTLSQVNVVAPERTSFDVLVEGLREEAADTDEEPSREAYQALLKTALGGVLVHQVERLLDEALRVAQAPVGEKETRSGLRISFAVQTQKRLVLLASIYHETAQKEQKFYLARRWTTYLATAAVISGLGAFVTIFLEAQLAFTAFNILAGFFVLFAVAAILATAFAKSAQNWLTEHAQRYETGADIMQDFAQKLGIAV